MIPTLIQLLAIPVLKWLSTRNPGGRTTAIALAILEVAKENPGIEIPVWDHSGKPGEALAVIAQILNREGLTDYIINKAHMTVMFNR